MISIGLVGRYTLHSPPLPIDYGTHHSKFMLVQYGPCSSSEAGVVRQYPGGLRVIVHTANYIYADCNSKEQGLWWQDFPIHQPGGSRGTAPPSSSNARPSDSRHIPGGRFSEDLERYLARLRLPAGMATRYVTDPDYPNMN